MIIKNGKTITSVYKGNRVIDKIYKGTLLVYEGWRKLIASGVPPLTLTKCKGVDLIDYKIYGNSVQDGTPTPETPIEVESVGEYDKTIGKYKIPVKVNSENLYNPNSPYLMNAGCIQGSGNIYNFPGSKGGNRETYFFKCKPNTTYRLYCETVGDRLGVFGHNVDITPTIDMEQFRFSTVFKQSPTSGVVNEYTWTTKEDTIWCAIYWSVNKKPTGIIIRELVTTSIYLNEPLRKLGEHIDYIDFENKKIIRNVAEYKFTGKETWTDRSSNYSNKEQSRFSSQVILSRYVNPQLALSNICEVETLRGATVLASNGIQLYNAASSAVYFTVNTMTLNEFKTWLASANAKLTYPLETPIEETIELPNIPTIKGTTIIEVDTNIQPSNMEVTYKGKGE